MTGFQPTLWPCEVMGREHEFDWWQGWAWVGQRYCQGVFMEVCRYCAITKGLPEPENFHSLDARL